MTPSQVVWTSSCPDADSFTERPSEGHDAPMGTLAPGSGSQDLGDATTQRLGVAPSAAGSPPVAALELRVHGVHGTSPASMLGVKDPRQVAGDGITGVFRAGADLPRRALRPGHAVEAYSWGALTSAVRGALGWVQRVLWLGLLPFALVNLAYWSRLHVGTDSRTGRWGAGAVRWAALLLTMLIVLTGCFISLDLVAWQCYRGGTKSCDVLPGQLDFMMFLAPSQRLVVAVGGAPGRDRADVVPVPPDAGALRVLHGHERAPPGRARRGSRTGPRSRSTRAPAAWASAPAWARLPGQGQGRGGADRVVQHLLQDSQVLVLHPSHGRGSSGSTSPLRSPR